MEKIKLFSQIILTNAPFSVIIDALWQNQYAGVAQSVVQLIRNQQVVCSSHITSSKTPMSLDMGVFSFSNPRHRVDSQGATKCVSVWVIPFFATLGNVASGHALKSHPRLQKSQAKRFWLFFVFKHRACLPVSSWAEGEARRRTRRAMRSIGI